MKKSKTVGQALKISLAIALALTGLVSSSGLVQTRAAQPKGGFWWPVSHEGTPNGRVPAGTRSPSDQCPVEAPLTALIPLIDGASAMTQESQKVWLYVPYSQTNRAVRSATFFLRDIGGAAVHKVDLEVPEKPSIVGVEFPRSLEVGKTYKWELYVDVDCGSQAASESDYLYGLVELVELPADLKQKLESEADPLKRYRLYKEANVWYGALTELAEVRARGEENQAVNSVWAELLDSAGWETEESRKNLEEYIIPAPVVSYSAGDAQ